MVKKVSIAVALCLALAMTLCGCGGPTPTETADSFLTAVKAGDTDTIKTVYEGETFDLISNVEDGAFGEEEEDSEETDSGDLLEDDYFEKTLLPKIQDFDYELSNEKIDGDKATVDVKITTYDIGTAFSSFISEYFTQALTLAFSDTSEEQIEKIGETLFETKMNELTEKTYSETVQLNLVNKDDSWKVCQIEEDSDFLNALCGNMIKTMDQLEDAYSFEEDDE